MPIFKVPNQSFRWLFAELSIVVLGILIAFQIEEWRNEVADLGLERALLENISIDIQTDLQELRSYRDTVKDAVNASVRFREYLESGRPRDEFTIMQHWVSSRTPFIWRRNSLAYSGWRESGRPDLISNAELRTQLYRYHDLFLTYLEERSVNYREVREEFVESSYLDFEFPIILDEDTGEPRRNPQPIPPLEEIPRDDMFMTRLNRMGGAMNDIGIILEADPNIILMSEDLLEQIAEHLASL